MVGAGIFVGLLCAGLLYVLEHVILKAYLAYVGIFEFSEVNVLVSSPRGQSFDEPEKHEKLDIRNYTVDESDA